MILEIRLTNISKKFNKHTIIDNLNRVFCYGSRHAITGANGSGKSTLLSIIAGYTMPSSGQVLMTAPNGEKVEDENFHQHITLAAPYLDLIEEFTLDEFLYFHFKLSPMIANESVDSLKQYMWLSDASTKQIRYFSSGMKQRLKLAVAFFTHKPIVLLDEPTVNLDTKGVDWYHATVDTYTLNRTLIIASNIPDEYKTATDILVL